MLTNYLFLLFTRNNAGDNRDSFSHYYVPNVEIKGFNILIDGAYEKIIGYKQ